MNQLYIYIYLLFFKFFSHVDHYRVLSRVPCAMQWVLISYLFYNSNQLVSSVSQSCLILCDPMNCSIPGFLVLHYLTECAQTHVHWVSDAIQSSHPLYPLLLLPSVFPSIRVFSSESVLCIRWPKYWSFSFSISPSNEYSGLISFRIDWFDLIAVQVTLKSLLQHHSWKHQFFRAQPSL